jgi:four helix bundle protein
MYNNVIREKTYNFALRIVNLYKYICNSQKEYVLSKQVLRSGTSIGAMVEEALQAESKADFIHKLSIANKESNETYYWLRLLRDSDYLSAKEFDSIEIDCKEIIKLLISIIKKSKQNLKKFTIEN